MWGLISSITLDAIAFRLRTRLVPGIRYSAQSEMMDCPNRMGLRHLLIYVG